MTEQELIKLLRGRDEEAFRWLVEEYRNKVFATILNITQNREDAEDAAQEVFIKVYESIADFKEQSSLSTWIFRIAVHKAIDKTRKRKRIARLHSIIPWWMPEEGKPVGENFHHPGLIMEQKEKAAVLFKAIEGLPEKQRVAFTLIRIQGMSYEETSVLLDQSIKAIESLISRAKINLQKALNQFYIR